MGSTLTMGSLTVACKNGTAPHKEAHTFLHDTNFEEIEPEARLKSSPKRGPPNSTVWRSAEMNVTTRAPCEHTRSFPYWEPPTKGEGSKIV